MKRGQQQLTLVALLVTYCLLCAVCLRAQGEILGAHREQLAEDFAQRATATLSGKVVWEQKDLSQTTIQVYRDEKLTELYTGVTQLEGGEFKIKIEPGDYYIVAFVDIDRSGKFDNGDGIGMLGITDWNNQNQQKQLVRIAEKQTISGLTIMIAARLQENQLVSTRTYRQDPRLQFKTELATVASGVKGTVDCIDCTTFETVLVFAYTDLSWKYRAGATRVEDGGRFALHLKPGKYYLMAIVDRNNTNLLDHGDSLGIYGISDLKERQAFPEPILVTDNKFTESVRIPITGKQVENGEIIPLDAIDAIQPSIEKETIELLGTVLWPGHNLTESVLQVYADSTLTRPIQQAQIQTDGKFRLQLQAGKYYLIANMDLDGDGRYGPGDGLGGYGTSDITTRPPTALTLKTGERNRIEIMVSARYNAEGQLEATGSGHGIIQSTDTHTGISGRIVWDGKEFMAGILSLSDTPEFSSSIPITLNLEDEGRYKVAVPPGDYYVMVIVDLNADRKTGLRDGIGIYGTRHPVRGEAQLVSVFADYVTPHIDIEIFAMYIDADGSMAEINDGHRSEIRLQHGEPEDIFSFTRFGREIEEWWYWTQGVRFTFATTTSGWKLQDREDFTPNIDSKTLRKSDERLSGANSDANTENLPDTPLNAGIYFSHDGIIWAYLPTGVLKSVSAGSRPTAALDGSLIYQDDEGNIMGRNMDSDRAKVLLNHRELATEAVISPSGEYIAFTRRQLNRQRIYLRHLPSNSELVLPSIAKQMSTPRWSINEELLLYSTRDSIENPDVSTGRNIYAYDLLNKRIEPISISTADDIAPAWSPSNPKVIAFSRAEGEHRQIWVLQFDTDGVLSEHQLTRYGGETPVWLPDGSAILYENNGQLWLVSPQGTENHPVFFNNRVLHGQHPCAIPFDMTAQN